MGKREKKIKEIIKERIEIIKERIKEIPANWARALSDFIGTTQSVQDAKGLFRLLNNLGRAFKDMFGLGGMGKREAEPEGPYTPKRLDPTKSRNIFLNALRDGVGDRRRDKKTKKEIGRQNKPEGRE